MSTTTKSPRRAMVLAYRVAQEALPAYAHRFSPRTYTLPQLFACLALKSMMRLDYRGVHGLLLDCSDLRAAIGLQRTPHFTTFQKAAARLLRTRSLSRLLDATIRLAQREGILTTAPRQVAADSTGLEAHHTSRYFIFRRHRGRKKLKNPLFVTTTYRRFPKANLVFDTKSHLILALIASRGPSADITHVEALMIQAWQRVNIHTALLDAGYDSERTHRLLRHDLGIRSIIPPKIGRPTSRAPTGYYRAQMKKHFPKKTYGQRWQAETGISMIKRRQGECVQAVSCQAQTRAMALKVLTHNIMILWRHPRGFLQSRTGTFFTRVFTRFFRFLLPEKKRDWYDLGAAREENGTGTI